MRLAQITLLLALLAGMAAANDGAAAIQDLAQFPPERQPFLRYVTTATAATETERRCQETALAFVVASTTRQDNLDYCRPIQVTETLWRLDLDWLKWSIDDWGRLVAHYPYHPLGSKHATLVRADWLIVQLTDQTESDAYLRLLFGELPKDRNRVLELLAVDRNPRFSVGLIQTQSGVSVSGTRMIENHPKARGYAWGTRDSIELDGDSDPLERPDGSFAHDGEEWIFGLPKFDPKTGFRGTLQAYLLTNAKGAIVPRAPVDLVRDHLEFRGYAEIRNPGSCIGCHSGGIIDVGPNAFVDLLKSGVEAYADYANYEAIEAFHFPGLDVEVRRNNEDFQGIVERLCGVTSEEASLCVASVVGTYDAPVTLERASVESYIAPGELKRALALGSASGYGLGARLSSLAHGGAVPREAFEENYKAVRGIADYWRSNAK